MELLVRAFHIPESRIEEFRSFSEELLRRRRRDTDSLFRRFGVASESWHVQRTAGGAIVILTTWVDDLERAPRALAASRDPFHVWFKQQLLRLTGTDPNREPLGPSKQVVFEWRDAKGAPKAPTKPAAKAPAPRARSTARKRTKASRH
jgi:hypothetical protein